MALGTGIGIGVNKSLTSTSYTQYGTIFSASTWSSLTGYTNNGVATFSVSGGVIQESGGNNALTNYLTYDGWYTRQEELTITRTAIVTSSPSGTTYGTGVGLHAVDSSYQNIFVKVDCTNGANQGKVYLYGIDKTNTLVNIATSSSGNTIANGDTLSLTLTKTGYTLTGSVTSSRGWTSTVSYSQDLTKAAYDAGTTYYIPSIGKFSIYTFGGTFNTTAFGASTTNPQIPKLIVIGNSKMAGSFQGSTVSTRIYSVMNSSIGRMLNLSNFGDKVSVEMLNAKTELTTLIGSNGANIKVLFADVASNDIRASVSSSTWQSAYNTLVQAVEDLGCTHYHCVMPESNVGGVDTTVLKTFIQNNGWNYSDTWTTMGGYPATGSYIANDGVHPTPSAVSPVSTTLISSYNGFSSNPYDTDASAYFARYAVQPSSADKFQINALIRGIKFDNSYYPSDSISNLADCMWLLANPYQDGAKYNIVSASYTLTEVNSPSWVAYQGYTFNGTSSRLNTNWKPATNGVKFTLNSASIAGYWRTNSAVNGIYGVADGGTIRFATIAPKYSDNNCYVGVNAGSLTSVAIGDSLAMVSTKRTAAGAGVIFKRGTQLATFSTASSALPTGDFYIGARNNSGVADSFDSRQCSFFFLGSGSVDLAKLNSRVHTLMTYFGTNV